MITLPRPGSSALVILRDVASPQLLARSFDEEEGVTEDGAGEVDLATEADDWLPSDDPRRAALPVTGSMLSSKGEMDEEPAEEAKGEANGGVDVVSLPAELSGGLITR